MRSEQNKVGDWPSMQRLVLTRMLLREKGKSISLPILYKLNADVGTPQDLFVNNYYRF